MSFFVKAAVDALKKYPVVNASVDGNDIVYHGYFDIGIAVGSPRGLVVPVLRDADQMSFAEIEKTIADFGKRAATASSRMEELTGGTFSISNGGVFGSMLSTPIINPPQSAILGMHATKERAVVENGQIVIRPMNYLALSYDHRIIDGREAVLSLVAMKEALEDPARLLLELDWSRPGRARCGIRQPCHCSVPAVNSKVPIMLKSFEVVVIGAGPAGYVAAIRCAQLGFSTAAGRVEERQGRGQARRHLPERRLHSVQGAAGILGELRARGVQIRQSRHLRDGRENRRRQNAGAQGQDRVAAHRRHRGLVQEEQDHLAARATASSPAAARNT